MTPAEHRAKAEELMAQAWTADDIARAQVHATLALTPPPPPEKPQQRVDTSKTHEFATDTGDYLTISPCPDGIVCVHAGTAWLMEDPTALRTLASVLTAHADRLESRS